MNTASRFWGPDAKEFNPDRFLDEERIPKQVPGHRHILTFVHGQRMCPGRHYALAEIKASVSGTARIVGSADEPTTGVTLPTYPRLYL